MATLTQNDLLEAIDKMTVLELSDFIKAFEERYGVTAAAPVAVAAGAAPAAGGDGAAPAAAEEQSEFSAVLTEVARRALEVMHFAPPAIIAATHAPPPACWLDTIRRYYGPIGGWEWRRRQLAARLAWVWDCSTRWEVQPACFKTARKRQNNHSEEYHGR